jgi:hypothetical protein
MVPQSGRLAVDDTGRSSLQKIMKDVPEAVANVYRQVFGSRLVGIAVHGSAVTGDVLPGLSDIDFVVVLATRLTLPDCEAVAAQVDAVEIDPFAYVQATYRETGVPMPTLVPGGFSVQHGVIEEGLLHTHKSLGAAAEAWMEGLPRLVEQDMKDWSVAVGRRPRQFRLILTRLKPTVRARLTMSGDDPVATYRNPWPMLIERLRIYQPGLATDLSSLLRGLRTERQNLLDAGVQALRLLNDLTVADTWIQADPLPEA